MKEIAVVDHTEGDLIAVKLKRATACGENCASCGGCSLTEKTAFAVNTAGASAGDTVILEMNTSKVLKASFMVYILPIIVFIAVYFIAEYISGREGIAALSGVAGMVLTFIGDIIWDKKVRDKYKLEAVKIIGQNIEQSNE